jgi:lactoylglutathione lyase
MHIEHTAMWVQDLERMRAFYETYFGAIADDRYVNSRKGFTSYFLCFPDGGSRLELMHMAEIAHQESELSVQFIGLTHLAISVGDEAMVDQLTERFRSDGYTIEGEPRRTGDGYYESVVLDPEQNRIEITV